MGSISRRSSRRGLPNNKKKQGNAYREKAYEQHRHTTNIITTNAAVIYNDDKAQQLVREIMAQPQKQPSIPKIDLDAHPKVPKVIQNEPEVPLRLSEDNESPNNRPGGLNQNQASEVGNVRSQHGKLTSTSK